MLTDGTALPQTSVSEIASSLRGRVVWITGASRGLGEALTHGFADVGAKLAITARSVEPLTELAARLPGDVTVLPVPGDVRDAEAVAKMSGRVTEHLGTVDVLVNMAGISPTVVRSERLSDQAWQDVIDVNLTGSFFCIRAVSQGMLTAGRGSIVNVSSVHASTGVSRMAAYAASKGGVEALTKALAVEWAPAGIRVNCLAPGYFDTSMTSSYLAGPAGDEVRAQVPLGRVGYSHELVAAAMFLASDAASYVTGAIFHVDGGWTAR